MLKLDLRAEWIRHDIYFVIHNGRVTFKNTDSSSQCFVFFVPRIVIVFKLKVLEFVSN